MHDSDAAEHAAHLVRRMPLAEGIAAFEALPVLHGNNGATLRATTMLAMLHWLGIKPSYSRPGLATTMPTPRRAVPHRGVPAGILGHGLRRPECGPLVASHAQLDTRGCRDA